MGGIKIFSSKDKYKKPQEYNNVTNLENGIWEKLFINAFIESPKDKDGLSLLYRYSGESIFLKFERAWQF